MEMTGGLKSYWRRNRYQHIDGADMKKKKKNMQIVRLGGKAKINRWRVRAIPKLKLRLKMKVSPVKLMRSIRDGYINMMIALEAKVAALTPSQTSLGVGGGSKKLDFKKPDEFEAKLVFEIYKSLMASRQVPHHS